MKRSHIILLGLVVAALIIWLLLARPRILGAGPQHSAGNISALDQLPERH